jgi:hypothetical protein
MSIHSVDGSSLPPRVAGWMMKARRVIRTTAHDLTDMWPVTMISYQDKWWIIGVDVCGLLVGGYLNDTQVAEFDLDFEHGKATVVMAAVHNVLVDEFVSILTKDGYTVVKLTMDGHSETITHVTPDNATRLQHVQEIPEVQ